MIVYTKCWKLCFNSFFYIFFVLYAEEIKEVILFILYINANWTFAAISFFDYLVYFIWKFNIIIWTYSIRANFEIVFFIHLNFCVSDKVIIYAYSQAFLHFCFLPSSIFFSFDWFLFSTSYLVYNYFIR